MIMRNLYTGEFSVKREIIHIGCKYKKPTIFYDGPNGIYWEVYPKMTDESFMIQKGLLKKVKDKTKKIAITMQFVFTNDNLPKVKHKYFNGAIGNGVRSFWKWS